MTLPSWFPTLEFRDWFLIPAFVFSTYTLVADRLRNRRKLIISVYEIDSIYGDHEPNDTRAVVVKVINHSRRPIFIDAIYYEEANIRHYLGSLPSIDEHVEKYYDWLPCKTALVEGQKFETFVAAKFSEDYPTAHAVKWFWVRDTLGGLWKTKRYPLKQK